MNNTQDTQAALAAAHLRHQEATQAHAEAQAAVKAAQDARQALIEAVARGGETKKTAADLATADDAIAQASRHAEMRSAIARATRAARDQAEVAHWQTQAADILARLRNAAHERIAAGAALDRAVAAAKEAAERFNGLSRQIFALTAEGQDHDNMVLTSSGNSALSAHPSQWPKTRLTTQQPVPPLRVRLMQDNPHGLPPAELMRSAEAVAQGHADSFGPHLMKVA